MTIPTVAIMLVQTIPNTVPWGVLSAHLHDFLATDEKLSMQVAPLNIHSVVSRSEAAENCSDWISKTYFELVSFNTQCP
jgi:hypothetical protein